MATTRRRKHNPERVLAYLRDFIELYGYPPTVRRIGDDMEISSTSAVEHILAGLERDASRREPAAGAPSRALRSRA